jgi:ADP-dependent phosphofructokinase/glucokinase
MFFIDILYTTPYTDFSMGMEIVLGLGDSIDYEIRWDSAVFEGLIREFGLSGAELNTNTPIKTERDLLITVLGFLKDSGGGELFVGDPAIIENFSRHFKNKITLGGTAIRAAIAMDKLGYTFALHLVTINGHVKRLMPKNCVWVCSNDEESSYPHLIVQFSRGVRVNAADISIETTRANRIIYTNDRDNGLVRIHPELQNLLTGAKVFLLSGFNAMHDAPLVEDRAREMRRILRSLTRKPIVFFEDGHYHVPELHGIIKNYLLEDIDIYSLNEDELQGSLGRKVLLTDAGAVGEALQSLHEIIPVKLLVVHTKFWALAYGAEAQRYGDALLGGITMAATRFRLGDDFTKEDYRDTGLLAPEEPGKIFSREIKASLGDRVCCVPSFQVPEEDATTIGLGDAFVGGFLPALIKINRGEN